MRAADSRTFVAVSLAIGLTLAANAAARVRQPDANRTAASSRIEGGRFEASGVVYVPGTDGVLFVDDGREDAVLWMQLDGNGRQVGAAQPVPIGTRVVDPEGITTDGTWFYVAGSQSKGGSGKSAGLVRFRFDPATKTARDAESVGGLRELVTTRAPSVGRAAGTANDGLNIEGLAWDAKNSRLLLGLRAPLLDGQAVVIPVGVTADAALSASALVIEEAGLMKVPLGNNGIRSLEFDPKADAFVVISADAGGGDSQPFRLWEWNPASAPSPLATFPARQKPEGVTRFAGSRDFRLLVFDTSSYRAVME